MSKKNLLLVVDGIVNLVLGILLMFFPAQLMEAFDLPKVETFFYVNILGSVLFGIGIALLLEYYTGKIGITGLGIGGAIAINFCGGGALVYWLLFGNLGLTPGGAIFLWSIAVVVLGVGVVETLTNSWKEDG
jgi:hypothetical protein